MIKVAIVDDDTTKLTQLLARIKYASINGGMVEGERDRIFDPAVLLVEQEMPLTHIVDTILEADCAIVDFRLSSSAVVSYDGVQVIESVLQRHKNFPIVLLTSHEDDVFNTKIFDVCHVFDFEQYSDDAYRADVNRRILLLVENHKREVQSWEDELLSLLDNESMGRTAEDDARVIELDTWLEQLHARGERPIHQRVKNILLPSKLDELIAKADEILEKLA